MKTKVLWFTISFLVLLSMILMSCSSSSTTSSTTQISTSTTKTSASTSSVATTQTTSIATTGSQTTTAVSTSTAPAGTNWWDKKYGQPQYGSELVYPYAFIDMVTDPGFDPRPSQFGAYCEWLFCDNMTIDRAEYAYSSSWMPMEYQQGWLAESWQQTDPLTWEVKIHEGIHWHDREPTNGREFTADDVVYSYDRALGTGNGFTEPNAFFAPGLNLIDHVEAVDRYTVNFILKNTNPMAIYQIAEPSLRFGFTAPEWYALDNDKKLKGDYVVGTGAFMVTGYTAAQSLVYSNNPNYWGKDERYGEQLPYLDTLKFLAVPDSATQQAAMRTGKVDMIVDGRSHLSKDQTDSLLKTNPDVQVVYWTGNAGGVTFRWGSEHFSDINVRKAMQMCVDTDAIAQSYYQGLGDPTPRGMANVTLGADWADPYEDWPQSLKDEYKYNIDAARTLMADAGYPNGFATNILFSTQDDVNIVQILKDYFLKIGVDMTINAEEPSTARMMVNGLQYDQMTLGGGGGIGGSPSDSITGYYSQKLERAGGVTDPVYDAFVDKFFAATTEAECQQIFKEASRYVVEQHWGIQLGTVKTTQVFQPWLKGWYGENLWSVPQFAYYARMWIDASLKK